MKTSLHIGGFWFHIKWDKNDYGIDQHGNAWMNKDNPQLENKTLEGACLLFHEIILLTLKNTK